MCTTIAPKMKENIVFLTCERPKIEDVKANIMWCNHKFENPIKNRLRSKISRTPSQCRLQYEANWFLSQLILAATHWYQQKEFLETGDWEAIHRPPKSITNGPLGPQHAVGNLDPRAPWGEGWEEEEAVPEFQEISGTLPDRKVGEWPSHQSGALVRNGDRHGNHPIALIARIRKPCLSLSN
jgi:hypothetical protein